MSPLARKSAGGFGGRGLAGGWREFGVPRSRFLETFRLGGLSHHPNRNGRGVVFDSIALLSQYRPDSGIEPSLSDPGTSDAWLDDSRRDRRNRHFAGLHARRRRGSLRQMLRAWRADLAGDPDRYNRLRRARRL